MSAPMLPTPWKRLRLVVAIFMAVSIAVVGVHSSPVSAGSTRAPVTLTYWNFTASAMPIEGTLISNFEKANPGIKIKLVNQPIANYENKVILSARTHSLPDVFQAIPEWLYDLVAAKAAGNITPEVNSAGPALHNAFTVSGWKLVTKGSAIYGLPFRWGNSAVFINPAIFRRYHVAIPQHWTMQRFLQDAVKLTHPKDGVYGFANAVSSAQSDLASSWDWLGFFFASGGRYVQNKTVKFDGPAGVKTMTWYADLFNKYHVGPPGMNSWITSDLIAAFGTGKIAMWLNGPWWISNIRTSFPRLKFTTVPLPTGVRYGSAAGGTIICVSSQTTQSAAAFKFIKYLTTPPAIAAWARAGAFIPPSSSVLNSGIYRQPPLAAYTEYANKPGVTVTGLTPKNTELLLDLQNGIQSVLLKQKSPAAAMREVTSEWNQVLRQSS